MFKADTSHRISLDQHSMVLSILPAAWVSRPLGSITRWTPYLLPFFCMF